MNPVTIVTSLIDIASKNGNLLLDVGPTANGTIVQVEQDSLRAAGQWIRTHGEAIFNTTYWFVTPQEGDVVRFMQTGDAFYILALDAPNATLVLDSPVPYVEGDQVTVVGGKMAGAVVPSRLLENGSLELTVSDDVRDADLYSWVFKIPFGGVETGPGSVALVGGGNASMPAQQSTNAAERGRPVVAMALVVVVLAALL
jgi:alpha-L-fucosidase